MQMSSPFHGPYSSVYERNKREHERWNLWDGSIFYLQQSISPKNTVKNYNFIQLFAFYQPSQIVSQLVSRYQLGCLLLVQVSLHTCITMQHHLSSYSLKFEQTYEIVLHPYLRIPFLSMSVGRFGLLSDAPYQITMNKNINIKYENCC